MKPKLKGKFFLIELNCFLKYNKIVIKCLLLKTKFKYRYSPLNMCLVKYSKFRFGQKRQLVPGRFEPPVTVIMLSPGVSGASRHLGFASESSLRSSRFLLDP